MMDGRVGVVICFLFASLIEANESNDAPLEDSFSAANFSLTPMIDDELELASENLAQDRSIDSLFHGFDLMSDDPFVFDTQPHQEQGRISVPSLLKIWNELVYNQPLESDLEGTVRGRSEGQSCASSCHPLASCQNGECTCKSGFEGDGIKMCEDIDECKSPTACKLHEDCLNIYSSFDCRCKKGFIGHPKGSPCVDVNECDTRTHTCKKSAVCVNTEGSFTCSCPAGKVMTSSGECSVLNLDPVLECRPNGIVVTVTRDHLNYFRPSKQAMTTNPNTSHLLYLMNNQTTPVLKECTLLPFADSTFTYTISIPFTSCSTEKVIVQRLNSTVIHYKNTLWWSNFFVDLPLIVMSHKMFDIDCEFSERTTQITMNASTVIQNVSRTVEEYGKANVSMKFWRFPPGHPPSVPSLAVPFEYVIGQIIYVTVELEQPVPTTISNTFLRMDNCYVSSAGSSARVDIITNGCSSSESSFKHQIISNGESSIGSFLFQMIQLHSGGEMFVKCDATLCKTSCKPQCIQGRRRRSMNETLGKNQVRIGLGNVRFTGGPVSPVETAKTVEDQPPVMRASNEERDPVTTPNSTEKSHNIISDFILPILLIVANFSVLIILGLISYALARSVASNRRLQHQKHLGDGVLDETVGYVCFSPPTPLGVSGVGASTSQVARSHSFCQDKDCHFVKDMKSKNRHGFNKKSRKKRQQSLFKPAVYNSSTLTCPTPFNSPPPSPPIEELAVKSVGTSPVRSIEIAASGLTVN